MENTCNSKECKLFELLGGTEEQCPNFVQAWWRPLEGEPKLVKDCAPKRTMIMIQEHYNRLIGLQQAQEEQRNESTKIVRAFNQIVLTARNRLNKVNIEIKELE